VKPGTIKPGFLMPNGYSQLPFFKLNQQLFTFCFSLNLHSPIFAPAGLARPAPAELPQGGNAARVSGCSGAM